MTTLSPYELGLLSFDRRGPGRVYPDAYRDRNGLICQADDHVRLWLKLYDPFLWAAGIKAPPAKRKVYLSPKQRDAFRAKLDEERYGRRLSSIIAEQRTTQILNRFRPVVRG